jgi:hypothetical protein
MTVDDGNLLKLFGKALLAAAVFGASFIVSIAALEHVFGKRVFERAPTAAQTEERGIRVVLFMQCPGIIDWAVISKNNPHEVFVVTRKEINSNPDLLVALVANNPVIFIDPDRLCV